MGLDIYGLPGSPPCRAVYLVANAIGLDYNFKKVDITKGEQMSADFLKMNPAHTIPTMDDDGFFLGDSKAIITYMMNKYAPKSDLYLEDPALRSQVDQRLFFDVNLSASIRGIIYGIVFNKNLLEYEASKSQLNGNLDLLEAFLGLSENAAGSEVTIADLAILANVATVEAAGLFEKDKWPRVSAWMTRLKSDLPYYSVTAEGCNWLGGLLKDGLAELGGGKSML